MKKLIATTAAFALALPGVALADPPRHAPAHGYYKKKHRDAQPIYRDTRVWRGMMVAITAAAATVPPD